MIVLQTARLPAGVIQPRLPAGHRRAGHPPGDQGPGRGLGRYWVGRWSFAHLAPEARDG